MKRSRFTVFLILCTWFVISFVTNILGPIMPAIIETYKLSLTLAAFLPFSFFLAYGIMSIPSGMLTERYGAKRAMLLAFFFNLTGAFLFALFPVYPVALGSLFLIGIGMAMLQVIINPLMRVAGGEENFAFYGVFAQCVFGAASFISPYFYVFIINELKNKELFTANLQSFIPAGLQWTALYWIFSAIFLLMLLAIALVKFPGVELAEDEKTGALQSYSALLKKRQVIGYFLGIMAYVGIEQGLSNWMSKFLETYHGISPLGGGAAAISWFWGSMSVGCLIGLVLMKLLDSRRVLSVSVLLTFLSLTLALFGPSALSLLAFPACGFFISLIFSIIFSLALNSETRYHGSFSGILCSGIFGGALIPLVIGSLGDQIGLRAALSFLYLPLGYIFTIPFWAKPLVANKVISLKEYMQAGRAAHKEPALFQHQNLH